MIETCKTFLKARLQEVLLEDETPAYTEDNIFFGNMDRDFLKPNDYAANCLILQDRKKRDGSIIVREKNEEETHFNYRKRAYDRNALFRCFLYAKYFHELWGKTGFIGFVDQFEQKVAEHRYIADSGNNCILIDLHDAVRPWSEEVEEQRLLRRPHFAISRVEFQGGVYTAWSEPVIPSVEITPFANMLTVQEILNNVVIESGDGDIIRVVITAENLINAINVGDEGNRLEVGENQC